MWWCIGLGWIFLRILNLAIIIGDSLKLMQNGIQLIHKHKPFSFSILFSSPPNKQDVPNSNFIYYFNSTYLYLSFHFPDLFIHFKKYGNKIYAPKSNHETNCDIKIYFWIHNIKKIGTNRKEINLRDEFFCWFFCVSLDWGIRVTRNFSFLGFTTHFLKL